MLGKDICNLLKKFRKELADKNGLDYEIKDCSHGDGCKGTCPFCEKETEELYSQLKEKESKGEVVDWTTSVELPPETLVLDSNNIPDSIVDSSVDIIGYVPEPIINISDLDLTTELSGYVSKPSGIEEITTKGLVDTDYHKPISDIFLRPLQGDVAINHTERLKGDVDPDAIKINNSWMNDWQGNITPEPEYPETPFGELSEFLNSCETPDTTLMGKVAVPPIERVSEDNDITIEKIREVRNRTARGMYESKKALKECNGDVDKAVEYLKKQPFRPLMGKIVPDND